MSQPLRIFLARHGQTDGARDGRFCGDIEVPLNATGLSMAEALGRYYGSWRWEGLYASPLGRTRQTAAPLAERTQLPVILEPGLREIAYGAWEGLLKAEIVARHPREFEAWSRDPGRHAPPGGETAVQIAERAVPVIDQIRQRHGGGNVMLVSHKATIRIIACRLLGIDVGLFRDRVAQPPGSVTVFEDGPHGPLLLALADVRHLPAELVPDLEG